MLSSRLCLQKEICCFFLWKYQNLELVCLRATSLSLRGKRESGIYLPLARYRFLLCTKAWEGKCKPFPLKEKNSKSSLWYLVDTCFSKEMCRFLLKFRDLLKSAIFEIMMRWFVRVQQVVFRLRTKGKVEIFSLAKYIRFLVCINAGCFKNFM